MTTTTELQLTFKNSEGKTKSISFPNAVKDLAEDVVRGAMADIAKEDVFVKKGVSLYHEPVAAKYIERNVATVFDDSAR
ncbi:MULTISPECIES: DUF2922 domain-containing protein [Lactobacillus]|jgi:hypothetical protein|uniref:DUF2922 domain-containing protein n=1 Tax=Lactobacillus porci TaxID=2012477 RepID=A0A6A8MF53_9LACO|nr:DUF2922 domain-containing protein [Lactobacillus porci]MDD6416598.1 DUF2922 domain-containing protein [Lactobacillus porci]MST87417.1 DUF2922 domain-containing protein [Lactobacillus porci]